MIVLVDLELFISYLGTGILNYTTAEVWENLSQCIYIAAVCQFGAMFCSNSSGPVNRICSSIMCRSRRNQMQICSVSFWYAWIWKWNWRITNVRLANNASHLCKGIIIKVDRWNRHPHKTYSAWSVHLDSWICGFEQRMWNQNLTPLEPSNSNSRHCAGQGLAFAEFDKKHLDCERPEKKD